MRSGVLSWRRFVRGKGLFLLAALIAGGSLVIALASLPKPGAAPWPAIWSQSMTDRTAVAQVLVAALASAGVLIAVVPTLIRPQRLKLVFTPHLLPTSPTYFLWVANTGGHINHFRIEATLLPTMDPDKVVPGRSNAEWIRIDVPLMPGLAQVMWELQGNVLYPEQVLVLAFNLRADQPPPTHIEVNWWTDRVGRNYELIPLTAGSPSEIRSKFVASTKDS